MIKIKLIYLFSMMCISFGYAHDADKAFFNIIKKGNTTLVETELPWSIRNALIAYDSSYVKAKTKKETKAFFLSMLKKN